MTTIMYLIALGLLSLAFAEMEVQIEGPNGWAEKLPTWRLKNKWTMMFLGVKPLTGYHICIWIITLIMVHLPFCLCLVAISWRAEARVMSVFVLFWVVEDFLWFVLNPAFGIKRFRPQYIWWHAPSWWWIMPRDYWVFTPIGVTLYLLSL